MANCLQLRLADFDDALVNYLQLDRPQGVWKQQALGISGQTQVNSRTNVSCVTVWSESSESRVMLLSLSSNQNIVPLDLLNSPCPQLRGEKITCQRGTARQCCKGHVSFLWEKPIFDPSQKPNPLSYNHKNLHD
jgi:hypothetical protein